jgi:hypothetical protein
MVRFAFLSLTLLSFAFIACNSENTSAPAKPAGSQDGHQRMIAILDSIYKNASPDNCYNLNTRAANKLRNMFSTASTPEQKVISGFKLSEQLLYAGQTEECIKVIYGLIKDDFSALNEGNKALFDVYGIAYMRLGEQQNCVENHTSSSCIIPIAAEGQHKLPRGSTKAIEIYTKILEKFPDDLQSRWLLNIANMTLGKYPEGVPAKYRIPENIFKGNNSLKFTDVAIGLGLDHRGVSGGVCMEDFDQDGDLDLFMTSYLLNDQCRFYINNGDGTFTEKTKEANLTGIVSGLNTLHADYDNDGDRDIFILRGAWLDGGWHPNSLLRNNGNATFTDVTIDAGLLTFRSTQTGAWADYNGDGWIDLFVANESSAQKGQQPCEFYINNQNGTFKNVADQTGMNITGFFKAVVAGDINNDQLPDLYLSDLHAENRLYINRTSDPAKPVFENITLKAGVGKPVNSFPAEMFDYNNDGFLDIFVCGYDVRVLDNAGGVVLAEYLGKQPPGDYARMYKNNGDETFTDVTQSVGLNKIMFGMGNNFGDLDNDGWLDLYIGTGTPDYRSLVPNRMYRNIEGKRFEEITMNGFAHIQKGHGVAFGDLDNDGDQDIYCVMGGAYEGDEANNLLFKNPGNKNKWITIFLEGKSSHRDAIGARVCANVVTASGQKRKIYASVGTGGSFGASSLRLELGLGDASALESIEVVWPKKGSTPSVIQGVKVNTVIRITEGQNQFETVVLKPMDLGAGGGGHHMHH